MSISWHKYKTIDYLLLDYRGLDDIGILNLTLSFFNLLGEIENKTLYLMIDCTGLNVTYKSYTKIRDVAKMTQPKIKKSVYVGLSIYSKTLYNVYRQFTNSQALLLDTKQEGLDYFEKEE